MIDVIVDQRSFGFPDGFFDGMKLLGQIDARSALTEHLDDAAQMAFGPLQSLDDIRVRIMRVFG